MQATPQTLRDIRLTLEAIAQHFPPGGESLPLSNIYLQVVQDSGELVAFDDNDTELSRRTVEQWMDNTEETFYNDVRRLLGQRLQHMAASMDHLGLLKPYSFLLVDGEGETMTELRTVDDDNALAPGANLMPGMDEDLDNFLDNLMKE